MKAPLPTVRHQGYQSCRCQDCHARGRFNCYPLPTDVLRDRQEGVALSGTSGP